MSLMILAAGLALLLAEPAASEAPIPTAPAVGRGAPEPTPNAGPLPDQIAGPAEPPRMAMGPCGPERIRADGQLDRQPHGEIEAGIGTGGYRRLAGSVCQPVGQNGALAVSIGETQFDGGARRR